MLDRQLNQLAEQFIANAIGVQNGEKVWLEWNGHHTAPLAHACMEQIKSLGGTVHEVPRGSEYINKILSANPSEAELKALGQENLTTMRGMDAYLRIGDVGDQSLAKDFGDLMGDYNRLVMDEFTEYRIRNTRWLVTRAPTDAFAKACGMSIEEFEPFYLGANLFDYSKITKPANRLKKVLADGKQVHIVGKETDLSFSIDGIGAKSCVGTLNIPDGEVFTAPVKGSVNGTVLFGPSVYDGKSFEQIHLTYQQGKIIAARSATEESTADLNRILDRDEGARYPGEFAIAFNPMIEEPVGDILFDEKIRGSFHIAQGRCYKDHANNGNESAIHWDMVQIQRSEYGGGTIKIDDRVIRRDGKFVVPELQELNPAQLLKL